MGGGKLSGVLSSSNSDVHFCLLFDTDGLRILAADLRRERRFVPIVLLVLWRIDQL